MIYRERDIFGNWFNEDFSILSLNIPLTHKKLQMKYPHYTKPEFKNGVDVFGAEVDGLHYVYDDRMRQWNWDLYDAARIYANSYSECNTAEWWEKLMRYYVGKHVDVIHIVAYCNWSNGFPCWAIGYRETKEE